MTAGPTSHFSYVRAMLVAAAAALLTACGGGGSGGEGAATTPVSTGTPTTPVTTTPVVPEVPGVPNAPVDTSKYDASRLLEQATFGSTPSELANVTKIGIAAYLDEQFAKPKTGYVGFNRQAYVQADDCKTNASDPTSAASLCARDNYTLFELQRQFFANAMTGEDQLRQRVAFALSQIFVVSGTEIKHAAGMAAYQNMLLERAFGNYRELMEDVTLSPVMGIYLDMVNNAKAGASTKPNENYAREFLQLFTVGTVQLNRDGTAKIGVDGEPLPTYSQQDVEAYARAFTGWTYSAWAGSTSHWTNPPKMLGSMVPFDAQHDSGAKTLLGVTLPAGQSARADLGRALDAAFNHTNVGPFVAMRLIQQLVTSNPSQAYVARVAAVFDDNGRGVRGDLKEVVRAILLDAEARGISKDDFAYGKLKDPVLFMTGFLRALGGKSDGVYLRAQSAALGQDVFAPPSVFNYYSPLQRIGGGTLYGPEFGIFDGATALARIDFVYQIVYGNGVAPDATVANSIGTTLSFVEAAAAFGTQPTSDLDARLMFGRLSQRSSDALASALATIPAGDAVGRARAAAYLLGVSAQYQVQR